MEEKKVEISLNPSKKVINILSGLLFVLSCTGAAVFGSAAIVTQRLTNTSEIYYWYSDSDKLKGMKSDMYAIATNYNLEANFRTAMEITIICIIAACIFAIISIIFTSNKKELPWYDRIYSDVQLCAGILAGIASVPTIMVLVSGIGYGLFGGVISAYEKILALYGVHADYDFLVGYGSDIRDIVDPVFVSGLGIFMAFMISLYELHIIKSLTVKIKNGSFFKRTFFGYAITLFQDAFRRKSKSKSKWLGISFALLIGSFIVIMIGISSQSGLLILILAGLWGVAIVIFEPKFFDRYMEIRNGIKRLASGDINTRIRRTNDNSELDELSGDINDISEAVKNAVEKEVKNERMKSALISNVSHDLKTPLTSMVSYIDLMKKEGLNSENAPEYLRILDEKTNRLKDLTLDLFDAAKAASGDLPVELQTIDLGSIVNQEVAEFQDVLEEKNIEIVINEQEPHIMAMADGRHLSRVLDNLLNNIKKYGMENSRAYIDITSDRILNTRKSNEDTVKSYNSDENASKSYNSNENTAKPDNGSDNNGGSDPTSGSNSQESGMLWEKAAVYRTTNQNNIYEEPNFTATDEIRKTKITIKNVSRDRLNISSDELIERFARGDSSRNTEGSGLGLAIARDLTNLMGGKFDIIIDGDLFKAEIELPFSEK